MNQADILFPMTALALLTLAVMLLIPYQRFKAAFAGKVTADDFWIRLLLALTARGEGVPP